MIIELLGRFMIIQWKITPYYPKCNGQAEINNKVMCNILTNIYEVGKTNWQDKLNVVLWAY